MGEALLRYLVRGRVHITSGGVRHGTTILPQAVQCMEEWGVPIASQTPSTLAQVWPQVGTFDVFVSIDEAPTEKRSPEQVHSEAQELTCSTAMGYDASLVPPLPAHWTAGNDGASVKEAWSLWSPRNPMIAHERSARKFQDHLYEGEPLFQTLSVDADRHKVRFQRRWVVPSLIHSSGVERSIVFLARVRAARQALLLESVALVKDLEQHYGEELLDRAQLDALLARGAQVVA